MKRAVSAGVHSSLGCVSALSILSRVDPHPNAMSPATPGGQSGIARKWWSTQARTSLSLSWKVYLPV